MTRPDGLHPDVPEVEYHADPALSQSGAKLLLPPSTPKHYEWARKHPKTTTAFDHGHAAHKKVLGVGAEIVVPTDKDGVAYVEWRSADAKAQVAEAKAKGKIPLHPADAEVVTDMATALRTHPIAGPLLTDGAGTAEVSAWWTDPDTGVRLRARFDWLTRLGDDRWMPVDYKGTAKSAGAWSFSKTAYDYGYDVQDTWYRWAVEATTGQPAKDTPMVFVVQEKNPPYLVAVHQLNADYRDLGEDRARRAVGVFCECVETGTWPGYPADEITELEPPRWAR